MPISGNRARRVRLAGAPAFLILAATIPAASPALAQSIAALPDQTSRIRLSNRDVNHIVCVGGEIEDVKFSAEKGLAVERGGSDAWVKFLVLETDDMGAKTRTYVTTPSEFFVSCNGAIYPLYAEPADIPAQTVTLVPGGAQRARANDALLGPLVEEERAVGIALAILQDRVPASFSEVAPSRDRLILADLPAASRLRVRACRSANISSALLLPPRSMSATFSIPRSEPTSSPSRSIASRWVQVRLRG